MTTKLIVTLAASCGLLLTAGDYAAARQSCCVKRAYCCSIKARCCSEDIAVTESVATLPRGTSGELAKPFCCVKRAYCCSIKRDCCPKTSIENTSVTRDSTNTPVAGEVIAKSSCCVKRAYCCSVAQPLLQFRRVSCVGFLGSSDRVMTLRGAAGGERCHQRICIRIR